MDSYKEWIKSITNNAQIETVNPEWVLTDTFFAIDENEKIVGIISLRHELKGFLLDFGHIGYSVRPTERCKGYATQMLKLILDVAKSAGLSSLQLSAERENKLSIKTIVKNGGIYERSFEYQGKIADVYRINL
ncbi:MAG: GNAT family N-acetyltransferase [Eubacteriales bacterium]|nr:GNAT family N-acetyltransferase [Eubacteriales bacterium]